MENKYTDETKEFEEMAATIEVFKRRLEAYRKVTEKLIPVITILKNIGVGDYGMSVDDWDEFEALEKELASAKKLDP